MNRDPKDPLPPGIGDLGAFAIAAGFLALGAWMAFGRPAPHIPLPEPVMVSADRLPPPARRVALADPPITRIGGFEQRCSDCHRMFESNWDGTRPLRQHETIVLAHGINDGCLNCHDRTDRDRLRLHDGTNVGYDDVALLCAQCHGPVYRDWERGVHGKTLGWWDAERGERRRLVCTACHDPHAPAITPIAPLPGPNTLRMGDPGAHDEASTHETPRHNPLRRGDAKETRR